MTDIILLSEKIQQRFGERINASTIANNELTVELSSVTNLETVCLALRDEAPFQFNQLIDVCGVDYLHYGMPEWKTESTTTTGFSRAVDPNSLKKIALPEKCKSRFAVVYHLLSLPLNQRLRLRVFVEGDPPQAVSVVPIWPSANWFEREAFDLYGIVFEGHPDLRRILTDYGFVGHPFRKDFPLIGQVEMRYDATQQRCIYEPVIIQSRTLVPKVIRGDARYVRPDRS